MCAILTGSILFLMSNDMAINKFELLIFFITNKCNARCKTCFYWRNINKDVDELSLTEIEAISSNLGEFNAIQITGGEPFLRDDIDKICEIFYRNNKVRFINIATNSLLSEKIKASVEKILRSCPKASVAVCCALDGIGEKHDEIRGVKGNFEKFKTTIKLLKGLQGKYPNFLITVLTTLCKDNYAEHDRISRFVKEELGTSHSFDITRLDTAENAETEEVPIEVIKDIHRDRVDDSCKGIITRIFRAGEKSILNKVIEDAREGKKWPVKCVAGVNVVVLEPNGDIRLCEHRDVVGNVRERNYKIFDVLNNELARKMRKEIITSHCSCDNSVFINRSMNNSRYYKITGLFKGLMSALWSR